MAEENSSSPNKRLSFRHINNWKMRTKLLALGLVVAILSVTALTLFSLIQVNKHTIEMAGVGLQREGHSSAELINSSVAGSVQDLETLALSPSLIAVVEMANQAYTDRDPVELTVEIAQMDTAWKNGDPSVDELVAQISGNELSTHLRSFQGRFTEQMETFVTDSKGLNVGMSARTGDYLQADEEWWLRTYNNGLGAIFIGDVAYDDTVQAYGIDIGVPIRDRQGQNVVGVLRGTVDITMVFAELSGISIGETGRAVLLDRDGRYLYTNDAASLMQMAPEGIVALVENGQETWYDNQVAPDGQPALISTSSITGKVGEQLGWTLMLYQDLDEIKQGIREDYLLATLFAAGLIVVLVTILSLVFARTITNPLNTVVRRARSLSKGEASGSNTDQALANKIAVRGDELGDIGRAFGDLEGFFKAKTDAASQIAKGNLTIAVPVASDVDTLGQAMTIMKQSLVVMAANVNHLINAIVKGELNARAATDQLEGEYAQIIEGVNTTVDSLVGFIDSVPAPFMVIDPDRNVRFINQAAAKATGKSAASAANTKCFDLFKTGECHNGDCALLKAMARNEVVVSETQAQPNGHLLDISYSGVPVRDRQGKVIGALEIVTDQTAVKQASRLTQKIANYQAGEVEKLQNALASVAQGNLAIEVSPSNSDEDTAETYQSFAIIAQALSDSVSGLRGMAGQMQEGAVNITSATAEILASSSQMASTTQEQASAVNQITSTVEEIKASAEQVAQRAQGVADAASEAARAAQQGSAAAEETIDGMDDIRQKVESIAENILSLSEQMQQIGDIIDTVTDIADQSNILALNAAIEAAQAGEAGKGFRVVADEVRSLAEQSRQAAGQVKIILGDIQKATNLAVMATEQGTKGVDAGTAMVNRTAQTIRALAGTVDVSAQAAQQIVAGVQQQTVGLDQIAIGMGDINMATQQTAAGAQQSQKAAQDLNMLADQLKMVVSQYKL